MTSCPYMLAEEHAISKVKLPSKHDVKLPPDTNNHVITNLA